MLRSKNCLQAPRVVERKNNDAALEENRESYHLQLKFPKVYVFPELKRRPFRCNQYQSEDREVTL